MLPYIDSGVQRLNQLIVSAEQSVPVDSLVAPVNCRIRSVGRNHDALVNGRNDELHFNVEIFSWVGKAEVHLPGPDVLSLNPHP